MPDLRRIRGTQMEKLAAEYLVDQGYKVIAHQYKTRSGEIDLVCLDGDEVVFVEVKARSSQVFGFPEESVHAEKLAKIVKCAYQFLQTLKLDQSWRIDVVSIEMKNSPILTHLKAVDIPDSFQYD